MHSFVLGFEFRNSIVLAVYLLQRRKKQADRRTVCFGRTGACRQSYLVQVGEAAAAEDKPAI